MSKKKMAALLAALLVTLGALSACSTQNNTSTKGGNNIVSTAQADEEQKVVTKIFEPGTHVYTKRYSYSLGWSIQRQVVVPDGYEILNVDNYIVGGGTSSHTEGFDVWFINNKTVEATQSTINISYGKTQNGFYGPGKVVEKEKELSLGKGE